MVWEQATPGPFQPLGELGARTANSLDMRVFVANCLKNHGHNVFLRVSTDQKCACKNSQDDVRHPSPFDEFDPSCSTCQGFGFHYIDLKMRAYRRMAFGLTNDAERSPFGQLGPGDTVWYFPYDQRVAVGHHIIEVTVDDSGNVIKAENIERIHEIKFTHLFRDQNGRPEYFAVLGREVWLSK